MNNRMSAIRRAWHRVRRHGRVPLRLALFAGLLAVFLYVPWLHWSPGASVTLEPPTIISGDEPHYLIVVDTLLERFSLEVGHTYEHAWKQRGLEAGVRFVGAQIDHHTIAVDLKTGEHQLWPFMFDPQRRNPDGTRLRVSKGLEHGYIEVPAHPPLFPALVAAFQWPFRKHLELVEQHAVETNAVFSFLALVAIWFAARAAKFSEREAMAVPILAGLASPMLPYAKSFFSEPLATLLLAVALWALLSRRPVLVGLMCALVMGVKAGFGLPAVTWAYLRWRQGRFREESRPMLIALGVGSVAIAIFNYSYARTPIVAGAGGFMPVYSFGNMGALFFSDEHGLFSFAPWAIVGIIGGLRWPELWWGALPVWFLLVTQDNQAGAYSYGPRYFVPFCPWLALATVRAYRDAKLPWRLVIAALVLAGALFAVPGALRYGDMFARPAIAALQK